MICMLVLIDKKWFHRGESDVIDFMLLLSIILDAFFFWH